MSKAIQLKRAAEQTIKVAVDAQRGIAVQARGNPATIVAYGATAGIVFISVGVAAGAYYGVKALLTSDGDG